MDKKPFDKGAKITEIRILFTNNVRKCNAHIQKNKVEPLLIPYAKINIKLSKHQNKTLEGKHRVKS